MQKYYMRRRFIVFSILKRLLRKKTERKTREEKVSNNFRYCKHWTIDDNRELIIYSDKVIDEKKAEEIVKFIERKVDMLDDPNTILSDVIYEIVCCILENKAMVSLAICGTLYNMYIMYNIKS